MTQTGQGMGTPSYMSLAEKAACALDGVDEPEDVGENFGVVGLALEAHQFDIDDVEALARLGEEFAQKIVHGGPAGCECVGAKATPAPSGSRVLSGRIFGP